VLDMRSRRTSHAATESISDRRFDRLLAASNPVADIALRAPGLQRALDAVGERITATPQRERRTVPRRLTVALAVAGATLAVAAVAFGSMLTTHTGFFGAAGMTENDTTEFLRTDAPDFPPLVAKLVGDIPFPPGDSAERHVQRYVNQAQPGVDGVPQLVQAAGIEGTFATWAMCAWRGYWLQEHARGNAAQATLAADSLATVASSDAVRKTDSWWPKYLALAENEQRGSAVAPTDLANWYAVNCADLPRPWASK
jgi:hypothetical protein